MSPVAVLEMLHVGLLLLKETSCISYITSQHWAKRETAVTAGVWMHWKKKTHAVFPLMTLNGCFSHSDRVFEGRRGGGSRNQTQSWAHAACKLISDRQQMLLFKVRRERLVASHVARMQRGLHCSFFLFLNLSVCVSLADQSGRPTGGRCSVRDGDRDEG